MNWQPIETAPKNQRILLWGRYWNDESWFHIPLIGMWNVRTERWEAAWTAWFGVLPTHWMPLPEPPK